MRGSAGIGASVVPAVCLLQTVSCLRRGLRVQNGSLLSLLYIALSVVCTGPQES